MCVFFLLGLPAVCRTVHRRAYDLRTQCIAQPTGNHIAKLHSTYMPVPSACSKNIFTAFKFFCACSIFFEHSQIFWSWSKARFYLINLHIWAWSKIFEHIQKILNTVKNIWTLTKKIWTSRWIRHLNELLNIIKDLMNWIKCSVLQNANRYCKHI